MKKKIVYIVAGILAFISVAQAEEPVNAANMKGARENARIAVLTMKNSKEFNEARAAQKAYKDAVNSIPEIAQLNRQASATPEQAKAQKQQRDKALKAKEKSLEALKKAMDDAQAALDQKMQQKDIHPIKK